MDNNANENFSTQTQVVFGILTMGSTLYLLVANFLGQGPMYWVAGWIADSQGRYSLMAAFGLAFLPFLAVSMAIAIVLERLTSRSKDNG